MIEQHVLGPDVGRLLWVALKAAPVLDSGDTDLDSGIRLSQGMKTSDASQRSVRRSRKKVHITVRGNLTLCGFPVGVVDDCLSFREIITNFRASSVAFRDRGCDECRYVLGVALDTAQAIA